MKRMHSGLLTAAIAAVMAVPAVSLADNITLSDGTKVTGTMVRQGDSMIITSTDGKKITVRASQITDVTITSNISPAERAENAWKQLQPSLNRATKLEDVIATLEKFETENRGTAASAKATDAIAGYKQLLAQSPVKFRGTWVAKDQVETLTRAELDSAKPIMAVYKSGKIKESLEQANDALKKSPENPHLLMVAGLASYKLNQLQHARACFLKITEGSGTSVVAHNNLGVVNFALNRSVEGLQNFTQALQTEPENRFAIDNACEALARSQKIKSSPNYLALIRVYQQSEAQVQEAMAKLGMYRNGPSWATHEQIDAQAAAQKDAEQKLAEAKAKVSASEAAANSANSQVKIVRDAAAYSRTYYYDNCNHETLVVWQNNVASLQLAEQISAKAQSQLTSSQMAMVMAQEEVERVRPTPEHVMRIMDLPEESQANSLE